GLEWVAKSQTKDTDIPHLDMASWESLLPSLDVWFDVQDDEIHHVIHMLPALSWSGGLVGVRLRYEPEDIKKLYFEYTEAVQEAREAKENAERKAKESADSENAIEFSVELWPSSLIEFLIKRMRTHFKIKAYCLDPNKQTDPNNGIANPQPLVEGMLALKGDPLHGLIKIKTIDAQRGLSDQDNSQRESGEFQSSSQSAHRVLSSQFRAYYDKHVDPEKSVDAHDLQILQAVREAEKSFDNKLKESFDTPLKGLNNLGYPGVTNPSISIKTKVRPANALMHDSAVQYQVQSKGEGGGVLHLPESYNGLGYQNLILIVFKLIRFRDEWMQVGKIAQETNRDQSAGIEPLHLVLIEEPEAHLHAQVQQLFIRKAHAILCDHPDLKESSLHTTQLIVSTHSSHVAHECNYNALRYFRRSPAVNNGDVPTSVVINLSKVFETEDKTARFVTRYLRITHSDLFFADGVIMVEGASERMLIPHFIKNNKELSGLQKCYITLLEVGGSHGHRLKSLIRHLGITTLVITDLDAGDSTDRSQKRPILGVGQITNNVTLKSHWHPNEKTIDGLINLSPEERVKHYENEQFSVGFAYQLPVAIDIGETKSKVIPYTFEDALAMDNYELFKNMEGGTGLVKKFHDVIRDNNELEEIAEAMFQQISNGSSNLKAKFALDLIFDLSDLDTEFEGTKKLKTPNYIMEGLLWMQNQLNEKRLAAEVMQSSEGG
ncbi:MAG: AAA family ATPase, partial [Magnetococcales bacterium]|nr:AAA family ATPase [Magnetococcales bacterium]